MKNRQKNLFKKENSRKPTIKTHSMFIICFPSCCNFFPFRLWQLYSYQFISPFLSGVNDWATLISTLSRPGIFNSSSSTVVLLAIDKSLVGQTITIFFCFGFLVHKIKLWFPVWRHLGKLFPVDIFSKVFHTLAKPTVSWSLKPFFWKKTLNNFCVSVDILPLPVVMFSSMPFCVEDIVFVDMECLLTDWTVHSRCSVSSRLNTPQGCIGLSM